MKYWNNFFSAKLTLSGIMAGAALTILLACQVRTEKPGCAISLLKQNVFYIGIDNPVSIVVRGVPAEQMKIVPTGVSVRKGEGDNYIVHATTPGEATITISGGELTPTTFNYRVKRIPDPAIRLGGKFRSRSISSGEFKAQSGLAVVFDNFDFDATCGIVAYQVTLLGKRNDPQVITNMGARFEAATQDLINQAKPGDMYIFDDINIDCPGDDAARNLGSLVFQIK